MDLSAEETSIRLAADQIEIEVGGRTIPVDRVVRAFPRSHPNAFISFLDGLGHEIGLLESLDGLDPVSSEVLQEHLKRLYFVPTIEEILSVNTTGTTSRWHVRTDEGEKEFQVLGRESLDGDKPPAIRISDSNSRKYQITDYWELDRDSRTAIQELLPDRIVKSKLVARNSGGMVMRMR